MSVSDRVEELGGSEPAVSLVIITYCRPDFVQDNLEHVAAQTSAPVQVVIVDGSPDDRTQAVVRQFPFVTYLRNPAGAGNMTSSRNEALGVVTGDVLAFLDDDAYPAPGYVEALQAFLKARPSVSLGCARTLNGQPDEHETGKEDIGRLSDQGDLIGNFAADPGRDVEIDHGIGASMFMRTSLVTALGGFREYYTGVSGVREDSDVFFRARALGHRAWFVHRAVAMHVAAPQSKGQRFDLRYRHWSARNHTILMMANFGWRSRFFWTSVFRVVAQNSAQEGPLYKRGGRTGIAAAGVVRGAWVAWRTFGGGRQPAVGGYRQGGRPLSLPATAPAR